MITVVKNGKSIEVDFGMYSSIANVSRASYCVEEVRLVQLVSDNSKVQVYVAIENMLWELTYDKTYVGTDLFIVDTIQGITPTSNIHLYELISSLRI